MLWYGPRQTDSVLDWQRPVNWEHPLNLGLVSEWAVPPGGAAGLKFYDLVRGAKAPNDGTLTNGPTWGSTSRPGGFGELRFDGTDDYVAFAPPPPILTDTPGFTLTGWMMPTLLDGNWHVVIERGNDAETVRQAFIGINGGFGPPTNGLSFFTNATGNGGVGTNALTAGRWYFFAAVHSGTSNTANVLYVWSREGGWEATTYLPGGGGGVDTYTGIGQQNNYLGKYTSGNPFMFSGPMDDIILYLRPLSQSEAYAVKDENLLYNPNRWRWLSTRAFFAPQVLTPPPAVGQTFNPAWARYAQPFGGGVL